MALTGLQIFKYLPKTNCKECGFQTCLAFAMALAGGKASLDGCPYVSSEGRAALESAAAPPIKSVKVGSGAGTLEFGDETELFRHDKRFFHPTGVAVVINDTGEVEANASAFNDLEFDRVGQHYVADMVAVRCDSGDGGTYRTAVETVAKITGKAMILICEAPDLLERALESVATRRPLLYAANAENHVKMVELAKEKGCPLAVHGQGLEETAQLVEKIVAMGFTELVIDSGARNTSRVLADQTQIRRLAIRKRYRPFGFPTIAFTGKVDPLEEVIQAGVYLSKYASIVVLRTSKKEHLLPLLSWRQDLYSDPQKPIAVEPGLHEVGDVNENSPVYCTTNFSLTYFMVEGEVENTRIPSYILSVDTGGTSVLTAYADHKFSVEIIAAAMKNAGLEGKVSHKRMVIPGYVAVLKGALEEQSGWNIIIGPREAAGISGFAKENLCHSG